MYTNRVLYEYTPQRLLAKAVAAVLSNRGASIDEKSVEYVVSESPSPELGDYGVPIVRFARTHRMDPHELVNSVSAKLRENRVVTSVEFVRGYLNIKIDAIEAAKAVFETYLSEGEEFGLVKTENPLRIIVEHTSANPVHPLHIGHARNASLGDTLARLLRARGHIVQTRFYIDDMGRQVATVIYGFLLAGIDGVPRGVKPDHFIGLVYAITHTLADIETLKRQLERLKLEGRDEEYREKLRELDSLIADASRLRERDPTLFDKIAEAIKGRDVERDIQDIMRKYEYREDEKIVKIFRSIVEECLRGFRETLENLAAVPEVWDWESDLTWSSLVGKILEKAEKSPYKTTHKGALALNLQPLLSDPAIRRALGLPEDYEVPPLILRRSDGTTLYTTRDIAYTIKKFKEFKADRVYNVIAAEQRLEQLQVRLALIALGYRHEGINLVHYAYEMVHLPGQRMSGRRGRYITLDELLAQAVALAREEVEKRSPHLPEQEKEKIARTVGHAAVRYALVSVSASKPMTFNIREALNFERSSAPYILYTHARAANILAKAKERNIDIDWDNIDYQAVNENKLRRALIIKALTYPYIFAKAADEQRPEILVAYINNFADIFNKWYASGDSAVNEPEPKKRNLKLALVTVSKQILTNTLQILGITPIERM